MSKKNDRAGEVKESGEVGGVSLIASDQAAGVLEPGEEPLHFPPSFVTAERPPVLGDVHTVAPMGRDELHVEGGQGAIEPIAVIGGVANQTRWILWEKASVQGLRDERDFVRRGRSDGNGDRKTSAVCKGHDLGPFAPLGLADAPPFFLALAKEPSMKVSLRSRPPLAWRSAASAWSTRRSVPRCTHA